MKTQDDASPLFGSHDRCITRCSTERPSTYLFERGHELRGGHRPPIHPCLLPAQLSGGPTLPRTYHARARGATSRDRRRRLLESRSSSAVQLAFIFRVLPPVPPSGRETKERAGQGAADTHRPGLSTATPAPSLSLSFVSFFSPPPPPRYEFGLSRFLGCLENTINTKMLPISIQNCIDI